MHYIVTYEGGYKLVINMTVFNAGRIFNGLQQSFLKFVESMGNWTTMEKTE